jgi:hypothetical protein
MISCTFNSSAVLFKNSSFGWANGFPLLSSFLLSFLSNGAGNVKMTGGQLRTSKLATTLPELTGTYTLTAGTIDFYGAGATFSSSLVLVVSSSSLDNLNIHS